MMNLSQNNSIHIKESNSFIVVSENNIYISNKGTTFINI